MTALLDLSAPNRGARGVEQPQLTSFRWERDMISPLTASMAELVLTDSTGLEHILEEVPSVSGVPDIIVARFDERALTARLSAGMLPVVDFTQVRTLVAVAGGCQTVSGLAIATGVSPGHLRGTVLPALAACGWLASPQGRGRSARVAPLHVWKPLAKQLITIEAKKSAWQRAVNQAMRHMSSANSSYIALDAARAGAAIGQRTAIARLGVGMLLVDRLTGRVEMAVHPRAHTPDPAMRAVLAERAWQLVLAGRTAGPSFPVFGRNLHAGVDTPHIATATGAATPTGGQARCCQLGPRVTRRSYEEIVVRAVPPAGLPCAD